jgi:hypothetical protein
MARKTGTAICDKARNHGRNRHIAASKRPRMECRGGSSRASNGPVAVEEGQYDIGLNWRVNEGTA